MIEKEEAVHIVDRKLREAIYTIRLMKEKSSCDTCLRQGCQYKDGTIRTNCPLWKGCAV